MLSVNAANLYPYATFLCGPADFARGFFPCYRITTIVPRGIRS